MDRNQLTKAFLDMDSAKSVIEDTHGNVSCRDQQRQETFFIKPSGVPYRDIYPGMIPHLDLELNKVDFCESKPSVDASEHASIYSRFPWVNSICHTHSPYATAAAIAGVDLDIYCTEHADYFGHTIRCCQWGGFNWGQNLSIDVDEQALLLEQHGVVIACRSNDPCKAVRLAIALEMIAKKYALAKIFGTPKSQPLRYEGILWHRRYNSSYGQ